MSVRCDGLLLVDKPPGPTSHDVVDRVRRALDKPKVGHAGTLDPPASGLLPLVVGRATRLVRYLPDSPKEYEGTLQLGLTTMTDDLTGVVLARSDDRLPVAGAVRREARRLEGHVLQVPPAISARRVGGRRLYELNRRGLAASADASPVTVLRFDVEPTADPAILRFVAHVSAGTYVRALVRDLGAALGCGAAVASLRRTAIGPLGLNPRLRLDAESAPEPQRLLAELIPIELMPLVPPPLVVSDVETAARFERGAPTTGEWPVPSPGLVRVSTSDGRFLGIGEVDSQQLRPLVVLAPVPSA